MYNPESLKAEEFISHEEILSTLEYAEANKNNIALIDEILDKAKLRQGLSHREASVLLACELADKNAEICALAEQIKKDFYGNRIVLFAPLYLSNYCVNGCVYCPYHAKNKHIARKKMTQEEVRREVIALQDMGHKREKIRSTIRSNIFWNASKRFTALSTRMAPSAGSMSILPPPRWKITANCTRPGSALISCFRKLIIRKATSSCIRPDRSTITPGIRKRWIGQWKAASTTWDWAFCSGWKDTSTNLPAF